MDVDRHKLFYIHSFSEQNLRTLAGPLSFRYLYQTLVSDKTHAQSYFIYYVQYTHVAA